MRGGERGTVKGEERWRETLEREREREGTERTSVDLDFKFQAKEAHISPR